MYIFSICSSVVFPVQDVRTHVAAADVPEELLAQKTVSFKDEEWFVLSSACDCGLKTIQLYRERA